MTFPTPRQTQFVHSAFWMLGALLLVFTVTPTAAETRSAHESWFLPPEFGVPKLSPDGNLLGFIISDGKKNRLGIFDLTKRSLTIVNDKGDTRPLNFWWKGPRKILAHLLVKSPLAATYSTFDIDGKENERVTSLIKRPGQIVDALPDDPDHVLLIQTSQPLYRGMSAAAVSGEVVKFNLRTGRTQTASGDLPGISYWLLDRNLEVRGAFRPLTNGVRIFYWRNSGTGPWSKMKIEADELGFGPVGFDTDPRYLWVWDFRRPGATSLARFDTQSGELLPGIGPRDGLEATEALVLGRSREPIALVYSQTSPPRVVPVNEAWRPVVERIQKIFLGYAISIVDRSPDGRRWIVFAENSRYPGGYFHFDRESGDTALIAPAFNPALTEKLFVAATPIHVDSRDGSAIRGRIWLPRGVSRPPVIIRCPSSLPTMPAADAFDPFIQFLVHRGFAVAEFDGRLTVGYSRDFKELMQALPSEVLREDFEDGIRGLDARGLIDAQRVALLGSGFGGALALSAAEHSSVVRAVVSVNAPLELTEDNLMELAPTISHSALHSHRGWKNSVRVAKALSPLTVAPNLGMAVLHLQEERPLSFGMGESATKQLQRALRNNSQARVETVNRGRDATALFGMSSPEDQARERASVAQHVADFLEDVLRK